jgi:hypothetical protein
MKSVQIKVMSLPGSNRSTPDLRGRYTEVTMKKNGKWVIVLDHAVAPLPPPLPPNETK